MLGERLNLQNSFEFSSKESIGQVVVGVRESKLIDFLAFFDRHGQLLCKIEGDRKLGDEQIVELNEDEKIIGIHCTYCERFIRGIGFFVYRPGIGIPKL